MSHLFIDGRARPSLRLKDLPRCRRNGKVVFALCSMRYGRSSRVAKLLHERVHSASLEELSRWSQAIQSTLTVEGLLDA